MAQSGQDDDALEAITEATGLYRGLAEGRPDEFRPGLAASLTNQSNALAGLGQYGEALAAITEAVGL